jgi:CheY-like chemotaxis protein
MAVHELATNAAMYGALSTEGGSVAVEWKFDSERDELQILWVETGGPPTRAPDTQGFGRLLLEQALAADLGGDVQLDFASTGLRCAIRIPVARRVVERAAGVGSASNYFQPSAPRSRHFATAPEQDHSRLRTLVVEDEFLLATMLSDDLTSAGYAVVGPFTTLESALVGSREEQVDLAVLDVKLGEERVYPLADQLIERQMPFVLLTGYGANDLPERFRLSACAEALQCISTSACR